MHACDGAHDQGQHCAAVCVGETGGLYQAAGALLYRAARVLSAAEQRVDILPGVRRQSRPVAGNTSRQMTRAAHAGAARRFGDVGDLLCGALPRPEPVVCA